MERRLPLSHGTISLSAALANTDDTLLALSYPQEEAKFFDYLESRENDIKHIVAWHLKLKAGKIPQLAPRHAWLRGYFNINIPVSIENWSHQPHKRVLFRIPLPYKVGEARHPGNVDEKLRCEVATFVWLLDKHPTVPVPLLWGFGFPTGACVRRSCALGIFKFGTDEIQFSIVEPTSCNHGIGDRQQEERSTHFASYRPLLHHRHDHEYDLKTGYLIMEFIEEIDGQPLSRYWSTDPDKRDLRTTFLADLSRIMLSLSSVKFNDIGSLRFCDNGFLSLSNRPLHFRLQQLENRLVPSGIPRSRTYQDARAYFVDLMGCHEKRIRFQRNSIKDRADAEMHFAVQAAMRAVIPHFSRESSSHGPFFFHLTDVHPNNVMVDETGHIKCLIDLEWAVVHPLEFIHPPVWLTGQKVDQLEGSNLQEYEMFLHEFLDIFEKEESALTDPPKKVTLFTNTLRRCWDSGAFFYFQGMENPKTCCTLFLQHILPRLDAGIDSERQMSLMKAWSLLWSVGREEVIRDRLEDRAAYLRELQDLFLQRSLGHAES